jgi:hypothetical protein
VQRSRFLRYWTGQDGAFNLSGGATAEAGALVMAALRPLADEAFDAARKQGRRERREAYAWDALVELASGGGAGPGGGGGGRGSGDAGRGGPKADVIVRVDHSALLRVTPLTVR